MLRNSDNQNFRTLSRCPAALSVFVSLLALSYSFLPSFLFAFGKGPECLTGNILSFYDEILIPGSLSSSVFFCCLSFYLLLLLLYLWHGHLRFIGLYS